MMVRIIFEICRFPAVITSFHWRRCSVISHPTQIRRGPAAFLLLAALAPAKAVAQWAPQPVFTELFAYDPPAPSQLLGKWLISSQLDSKLQPLRCGKKAALPATATAVIAWVHRRPASPGLSNPSTPTPTKEPDPHPGAIRTTSG
jgi:hypothetical protein